MQCCCCKCQFNAIPDLNKKIQYPYILPCNHSACEKCLKQIVHGFIKVTCKFCDKECSLTDEKGEKPQEYTFPVNFNFIGRSVYNYFMADQPPYITVKRHEMKVTNLQVQVKPTTYERKGKCFECKSTPSCICIECDHRLCDKCYLLIHAYKSLKGHTKQSLEYYQYMTKANTCNIHPDKESDLYCMTCLKYICSHCLLPGDLSCNGHNIISLNDKWLEFRERLIVEKRNIEKLLSYLRDVKHRIQVSGLSSLTDLKNDLTSKFEFAYVALKRVEIDYLRQIERRSNIHNTVDIKLLMDDELKLINLMGVLQFCLDSDNGRMIKVQQVEKELDEMYQMSWILPKVTKTKNTEITNDLVLLNEFVSNFCKLSNECNIDTEVITPSKLLNIGKTEIDVTSKVIDKPIKLEPGVVQLSNGEDLKVNLKNWKIKPLKPGIIQDMIVTYVKNPCDFYIQYCQNKDLLKEESKLFSNIDDWCVSKDDIAEGNILVYRNISGDLYRVSVIGKCTGIEFYVKVKFIDEGSVRDVCNADLFPLNETYKKIPPLAFKCTLKNCIVPSGGWTDFDIDLMNNFISGSSTLSIYVDAICDDYAEVSLKKPCPIVIFDKTSLCQVLAFHNAETSTEKINKLVVNERRGKNIIPVINLLSDDEVTITNVVSPSKFYVRRVNIEQKLSKLIANMNAFYENNQENVIYLPKLDTHVACHIDNLGWCRGYITNIKDKDNITVFLIDHGITETVPWTSIKSLNIKFTRLGAMAIMCSLYEVKPLDCVWSTEATQFVIDSTKNWIPSRVQVICSSKGKAPNNTCFTVVLYNNMDNKSINDELIDQKFAKRDAPVSAIKKKKVQKKRVEEYSFDKPIEKQYPGKVSVKVLEAISPSEIYISYFSDVETKTLSNRMRDCFEKSVSDSSIQWKVGDNGAVYSLKQFKWFRCQITKEIGDSFEVFMSDIAKTEIVTSDNLREMPEEFLSIRSGSVKCSITGIVPANGNQWPKLSCEYLQSVISNYPTCYISIDEFKMIPSKDKTTHHYKILPVHLWVLHFNMDDPTEPTKEEWKSVSDMIVMQGLAIRDKSINVPAVNSVIKEEEITDDEIAEITKTIPLSDDKMKICTTIVKNLNIIKEWKPVELLQNKFVGIPTYVDDDFHVYIVDVNNEPKLAKVNAIISKEYKDSSPQPCDMFWNENQPCIVQWDFDSKFYRAVTRQIVDDKNVLVQFVDYGNDSTCSVTCLRKNIVTHDIPVLALKCKIAGIQLATENIIDSLDLIHSAIVEKHCNIEVIGREIEGDVYYIKLFHKEIQDLGDYLVDEKKMATRCNYPRNLVQVSDDNSQNNTMDNDDTDADIIVEVINDITDSISNITNFPKWEFLDDVIKCQVVEIIAADYVILKLSVYDDLYSAVREKLEFIFEDISKHWQDQPLLKMDDDVENCIAFCDGTWYRGEILQKIKPSKRNARDTETLYKVNLIDYGCIELVLNSFVRELKPKWMELPPMTIAARLDGVSLSDEYTFNGDVITKLREFYCKDVYAKMISKNDVDYTVELLNDPNNTVPAYQELVNEGLLKKQ